MSRGPEKWYGNLHWEPYHLKKWYGFGRVCRIGSGANEHNPIKSVFGHLLCLILSISHVIRLTQSLSSLRSNQTIPTYSSESSNLLVLIQRVLWRLHENRPETWNQLWLDFRFFWPANCPKVWLQVSPGHSKTSKVEASVILVMTF